ncbi:hypothetical protein CPB83DRAFT_892863 [Crepidotus variabilis]|uniref:Uncharacterized protein n=1 Tax=Crepidotus variabilis TaxID=179855 RepID=A0A9P6JRU8_9AGAR|nr:hypothetical protein CPB83DRAFT_892863 [Crepidotus variabilis]
MPILNLELAMTHLAISWINALLFTLEIILAVYYLSHYTAKLSVKCLIYGIMAVDSLLLLTTFTSAWVVLIQDDLQQGYNPRASLWTVPLSTFLLATLAVTQELLLVSRFHALSRAFAITIILLLLIGAHAILSLYSGFYVITQPSLDPNFERFANKASMILAALASLVDTVIPLAVSWQLYKVSLPRERSFRDVLLNAVSCGGIGGLVRLILLVLFFTKSGVFYVLVNIMGRIYVITLLVNLLIGRKTMSTTPPSLHKHFSFTLSELNAGSLARTRLFSSRSSIISRPDRPEKALPPLPLVGGGV